MPAVEGLRQRPPDRLARVVDQDVDAAEVGFDLGDEFVDGIQIGQVAGPCAGRTARCGDAFDQRIQQVLAPRDRHHVAPRRANFSAATSPMPDDAPVSRIRLPSRSISSRLGRYASSAGASGGRMLASTTWSTRRRSGFLLTARESRRAALSDSLLPDDWHEVFDPEGTRL